MTNNFERAELVRKATFAYLKNQYGTGDLSWHPLLTAVRDLYCAMLNGEI